MAEEILEEVEQEVLTEPAPNMLKKLAVIVSDKRTITTATINGQPVGTQEVTLFHICCPTCGRIIYSFPEGTTMEQAVMSVQASVDELRNIANYCPGCGQKLDYIDNLVVNSNE